MTALLVPLGPNDYVPHDRSHGLSGLSAMAIVKRCPQQRVILSGRSDPLLDEVGIREAVRLAGALTTRHPQEVVPV